MPTQAAAARHLDLSTRALRELISRAVVPNPKSSTLDDLRTAYIRHLRLQASGRRGDGQVLDLAKERARLAAEQARHHELKNAELEERLLDRDEVIETWSEQIGAAKRILRALPKRLAARVPKFTQKMARDAQKVVDEALHELAGDGTPKRRRKKRVESSG